MSTQPASPKKEPIMANVATAFDKNSPEFRKAVIDTIKEMGLDPARLDSIEMQQKLKEDPFALEKLERKLTRAELAPFFKPENKRPATEFYWIGETLGSTFMIPLSHTKHSFHQVTGRDDISEFVPMNFVSPPHSVGTDLSSKHGDIRNKYYILWADLSKIEEITVTEEDITNPKLRIDPSVKPHEGRITLAQAMAEMDRIMVSNRGPRALMWGTERFRKLMSGEEFRVWALAKYNERWGVEDSRKQVTDLTRDFTSSEAKTGEALERLLDQVPALV